MQFLARATMVQLRGSLPHLLDLALAANMTWFVKTVSEDKVQDIIGAIDSENRVARLFAAAAAARLAAKAAEPLEHAASSSDPEVSSFAQDVLKNRQ